MKRFLAVFLMLVMTLSFASCVVEDEPVVSGDEQKTEAVEEKQEENQEKKQEEKLGLNSSAEFKTLKFTATEIEESTGNDFFSPADGKIFVGIKFTIENISDEEQCLSSLLMFGSYVDDVKCDFSVNAACVFEEGTLDGVVAPGKKLVGWYSLEVPEDWSTIEVSVKADWLSSKSETFVFNK